MLEVNAYMASVYMCFVFTGNLDETPENAVSEASDTGEDTRKCLLCQHKGDLYPQVCMFGEKICRHIGGGRMANLYIEL